MATGCGARAEAAGRGEFSAAAYRFGHSQVRPGYRINLGPDGGPTVFLSILVFIGLLQADADSYVSAAPSWKPTLPSAGGPGSFRMTDLLRFAGVVPTLP